MELYLLATEAFKKLVDLCGLHHRFVHYLLANRTDMKFIQ
jgi:hypothetical protein